MKTNQKKKRSDYPNSIFVCLCFFCYASISISNIIVASVASETESLNSNLGSAHSLPTLSKLFSSPCFNFLIYKMEIIRVFLS